MAEQVLNTVMIPVKEYAELRAAADLLARVRAGCIGYTERIFGLNRTALTLEGPDDLLRELAEALTSNHRSDGS